MRVFILFILVTSVVCASENAISATGLRASSFGDDGRLSRVFTAQSASGPFASPVVRAGKVEFYGKEAPNGVVAALEWEEAKYLKSEEVITGDGSIHLTTEDGIVSGKGFRCELDTERLELRSSVSYKTNAFRMTGEQAKIEFETKRGKRTDVIRHIAVVGNIVIEQTATAKAPFDRAESTFARYSADESKVFLKAPISAWRKGQRSVIDAASGFVEIDLKEQTPNKAPEPTPGAVTPRATEGASK